MRFTFLFRVVLLVFVSCTTFCYAQPPNDTCLTAEPIVVGVGACNSILYTNVAATTTGNPATPACWSPNSMSHTVWFSFVATIADIEISTNFGGTLANTQIAVYSGACGSLTLLGCQEDINTGGALLHTDLILHGLTVGNTYYIAIDGNGNTTGTFGVCAQESLPVGPALPTQDCAGSQTLCDLGDITVPDGAGGVGLSQEFPSCFGAPGERSSNWYSFTAATTGTLCFTINPNTSVDYDFAVYNTTASCPGVELTCNWSPTSPITGLGCAGVQCETCITVTAGETYAILVDRFTAASNSGFTLNFAGTTATFASPNPTFTASTACIGSPTQFTNTTNGNYTYSWNFGDGFTSNLENPTHTYASAGTYTATLLVTAVPGGCQNSITQSVTVNPLPTVNAGTGGSVCPNACITLGGTTNATGSTGPVTFNNSGTYAIPDNDPTGVFSPISVSGILPATINNTSIVSVCIDLTHTFDGDLDIFLVSPNGNQIRLSSDNGGANSDYIGTCFSASATTAITAGAAPFTGTFIPEQAFTLLNGDNSNGVWQLFVRDDAGGDTGDITNWSITLNTLFPAFTWSPTTAMTNANTLSPTVCPAATATYTLTASNGIGCTTTSQVTVNVNAGPTATIAYSSANYCTSAAVQTVTLNGTGAYTGGTYASTAGLSINATTGAITPSTSTPGPYVVSYTIPASGGCPATTVTTAVTINAPPVAGTLSGNQNICVGLTSTFSSTAVGGTWSSSDTTIATINPASGLVTGVAAGTATMTYTVVGTGGCANVTATRTVTVTAALIAGTLSGNQNICVGLTSTFSSTAVGGTWSSSDITIATINAASGLVTGVAAGTATMTYTVVGTGGCANVTATRVVTVTAAPIAGTLSGNQNICVGLTSTFSSTAVGGTWSSSDITVATINPASGIVTGIAAGTATMTYTVIGTGGCANVTATRTVTVTAAPIAGTLSGNQNICVGLTSTFSSTAVGGTWSSSDITVATINPASGLITGVAAGTATMTYTVLGTGGCANVTTTRTVTVTAAPIAGTLSGNQNICVGLTSTFSSTAVGGTWSSSDSTIATINATSGLVTGITAGTATMTYTVVGTGGCANVTATRTVTVNPYLTPTINCGTSSTTSVQFNWSAVLGATGYDVAYQINASAVVNIGAIGNLLTYSVSSLTPGDNVTITLTPTGAAGTCFTANTAICNANNCSPPTASISYLGTPFCDTTSTSQSVTLNGTGAFNGGVYASTTGLSINAATGDITPNTSTPGPYTVTYTIAATAGCSPVIATTSITITAAPIAGTLSGNQNICVGLTSTFSSTAVGGTWSSSDITVATINPASGLVTGVAAGTATMTYTVLGTGGCVNVTVTRTVTVTAAPIAGTLSGNQNICVGLTSTFSSTAVGGTWSSSDITVATINPASGLVTGVAAGTATMTYTVLGTGGCANVTATRTVTVTAAPIAGTLSGNQNICVGLTSTFSSTAVGGTWSSSDTTIATINATSGLVTGIAAGTATMTYTVVGTGGCANVTATRTVTVNPYLTPTINCGTSSTTSVQFNWSAVTGATGYDVAYQINASAVVNIGAIGNLLTYSVSSLTPGDNVTITLTPTGAAGTCFTANTAICTANNCSPPTASISYLGTPFCDTTSTSQTVTLNGTGAFNGGVYASTAGLSINAVTGDITPNTSTPGPYTVTYTIAATAGCSPVIATTSITITAAPIAGTLSGNQNICVGLTSTFSSTAVGGSWSSSDITVATINPASGLITGIAAGTATMTYTVLGTGGCANVTATRTVTVTAAPIAGTLNGNQNICVGLTSTFSSTAVGGTWSSSDITVATINPASGLVTGVAAGTATMIYTVVGNGGCANVTTTRTVTVTAAPIAGTLSGNQNICVGLTSTFSSTAVGGTWSSSDTTIATINATSGLITGIAAGTATMTYTVLGTGGCANVTATRTVTVTAAPIAGTLSGNQNICVGLTSTFSSTAVGGTWSSSDTTIATINAASGLVTGVAAGTATMIYTVVGTGGCANVTTTRTVTVTAAPIAGTLSGNQNICVGLTSTFSSTAVGGTWSSSDTTIATINATSGLITGIAAGTATMNYTVLGTGGCANVTATRVVTVTAAPIAGTLSGNQNICVGLTSTFSSTAVGGTWSSSDITVATINPASGLVTGIAAGTATMTYTVVGTGGCANVTATRTVTVTAAPIAGTLSGNQNICVGLTSTFSSTAAGGTWSSSDTTIATINPASGLVTGVAAGTATMTYTVVGTGGCANVTATRTVTVTAAPIAGTLSGNQNICVGLTSTFSSTAVGGTWGSSDTTIATINPASGIVTGVASGIATMTYTVVGTGGCVNVTVTRTVTVTAAPIAGTLSGNQNICVGLTSSFSSTAVGGTWSSSDNTIATINATSGLVTGVTAGTATMTYTVLGTGGCANVTAIRTVTVTAAPIIGTLSGNQNICVGLTSTFSSTTLGGTWSSSDINVATINPASGLVNGIAAGTATMTYTVLGTGGCANVTATRTVTVTAAPIAGTLSGNQVLCAGSSSSFSSTINGGAWVSSDLSVATINSLTGLINGVSAGTCTMTYTVIGTGGCANVSATRTVTVEPTPSVILSTNPINICSGDSPNIILTADFLGTTFSWTAQQNNVIGATLSGIGNFINPTLTSTTTNVGTVIYTVTPTLNNCVGNPSFLMVKVNPKPIPVLNDGIICVDVASGNTTQTHTLSTGLNNTNYSHQWYFDGNSFSNPNGNNYSANQAGNYSVIATNINTGCISEEVFATVSASIYTTTFTTSVSEAFSDNAYIIINTPSGSGPFQYQLDYGPFQNSNIFYNVYSGLHKISIKDEAGCTDLHGEIVILNYPKFFTPNGDTYNDTWNIESLIDIPNSGIYIFDRYGKFIKQISPKGKGWDGTFNGYELPSTDYWFTVDFVDPNSLKSSTFKSHFSLKR